MGTVILKLDIQEVIARVEKNKGSLADRTFFGLNLETGDRMLAVGGQQLGESVNSLYKMVKTALKLSCSHHF